MSETGENPAEVMRSAADLMRERAQAATPGPWWADESENCWRLHGVAFKVPPQKFDDGSVMIPEQVINKQILKAPKHGTPYAEYWPDEADAVYIPSMHPLVGLAVAKLLSKVAWAVELDADLIARVGYGEALEVARIFLSEQNGPGRSDDR